MIGWTRYSPSCTPRLECQCPHERYGDDSHCERTIMQDQGSLKSMIKDDLATDRYRLVGEGIKDDPTCDVDTPRYGQ